MPPDLNARSSQPKILARRHARLKAQRLDTQSHAEELHCSVHDEKGRPTAVLVASPAEVACRVYWLGTTFTLPNVSIYDYVFRVAATGSDAALR